MWMKVGDVCLLRPPSEHLRDATCRHKAANTNPQLRTSCETMLASLSLVSLDGLAGLVAEWTGAWPATLAEHDGYVLIEVDVGDLQACHFRQAHTRIQEEPNNRCVTAILEPLAAHAGE